jgi:hypothetical protein
MVAAPVLPKLGLPSTGLPSSVSRRNLAYGLVRILGWCHALPVANCHEQVLTIGREYNLPTCLASLPPGHLAPEHRKVEQPGRALEVQLGACQDLPSAIVTWLDIGEIDALVSGELRRDVDAQHPVLPLPIDGWSIAQRSDLFSLSGNQPNGPDLFGHEHAPVRRKAIRQGRPKVACRGHLKR